MNEQNQIFKLSRVCGFERKYDNYHRLYVACKNCASIGCAKHYEKNREEILEKARRFRENNKDKIQRDRKTINSYEEDIQNLCNKIDTLTTMMKYTTLVN